MSQLYVCAKCKGEMEPPIHGTKMMVCSCGYATGIESAMAAGDARMLARQQRAEAGELAKSLREAACPRCASKPCMCDIQKPALCEDQGCPQSHVPHVCVTKTDCRTEEGITVGLIDTIINSARLLKSRSWNSTAVLEALKDLRADEDLCALTGVFEDQQTIANLERENDQHKDSRMNLATQLGRAEGERDKLIEKLAKANKRADQFLAAVNEWLDKTDWIRGTLKPKELGMHRADVMTARLQAQAVEIKRDALAGHLLHALSVLRDHHLYGDLPSVSADVRDCLNLIGEPFPMVSGAPKPVGPTTYTDFVDIESRNDVQEALQNFSHDSTRDNAVELIRAIYEAVKPK